MVQHWENVSVGAAGIISISVTDFIANAQGLQILLQISITIITIYYLIRNNRKKNTK